MGSELRKVSDSYCSQIARVFRSIQSAIDLDSVNQVDQVDQAHTLCSMAAADYNLPLYDRNHSLWQMFTKQCHLSFTWCYYTGLYNKVSVRSCPVLSPCKHFVHLFTSSFSLTLPVR